MQLWAVLIQVWLCGVSYTHSQSLTMTSLVAVTECKTGLRANEDRLIFSGTVNATGVNFDEWDRYISFIIGFPSSGRIIRDICNVNIESCTYREVTDCYCTLHSANVYTVVLNLTAMEELSSMSVKLVWPNRDFRKVMVSNWLDGPMIYKPKSEVNILQVNLDNISLSSSCKLPARNSLSYIQYCCSNAPSPCVSTIEFQGVTVTGSPCAVGNFIIAPDSVYKLSHTVCGGGSQKQFSCLGVSVTASSVQVDGEEETPITSYNGYRNAAIFLASIIAIGLIIATVHRLDASLLFSSGSRRRIETVNVIREDRMNSSTRPFNCC